MKKLFSLLLFVIFVIVLISFMSDIPGRIIDSVADTTSEAP